MAMRKGSRRRSSVWLVALLRAALLVIVFHTSGLAHLAADVHELVTTGHHSGTPFDDDDDGPSQAPGSPSCHHAQPGAASLGSPFVARLDIANSTRVRIASTTDDDLAAPPLRSVYRPPRA